jgi:hypothetical protein
VAVFCLKKRSLLDHEVGFNCHIGLRQEGEREKTASLQSNTENNEILRVSFDNCPDSSKFAEASDNLDKRSVGKDSVVYEK